MERWISLHEKLKEHWVFNDHNALRIWLLLLWDAYYKDTKVRVDGKLTEVKMGQYVTSIRQLAIRYGFTRYVINNVLNDLENDGMIIREPIGRKWTLLTIVNYPKYQGKMKENEKISANDLATDLARNLPHNNKGYKGINNNIEREKEREEKPLPEIKAPKYPTGKYNNVMLTQEETVKLSKEFPNEAADFIERLSEYMEIQGKKYNNHYAVLCKWIREDRKDRKVDEDEDQRKQHGTDWTDHFFDCK